MRLFGLSILSVFCFSFDYFVLLLFAFVVLLGLVFFSTAPRICWEELLRNDLFCVEWDVKP